MSRATIYVRAAPLCARPSMFDGAVTGALRMLVTLAAGCAYADRAALKQQQAGRPRGSS